MSTNLVCKDPFGYKAGLESGDPLGPSPINIGEIFISNSGIGGGLKKISTEITIDSVFSSFSLNQDGGNWSRSGYLYEIWIAEFVNNNERGNILNSGKSLFLLDRLTLQEYELVIIDTQDVNDITYGDITKVLVADPLYLVDLLKYVNLILQGQESYSVGTIPLAEYSDDSLFSLQNDIEHRINLINLDRQRILDLPLNQYSSNQEESMSVRFYSSNLTLSYPEFKIGGSLRLEKRDNPQDGFEVTVNQTPTYIGQLSDQSDSYIEYLSLKIGAIVSLNLTSPVISTYSKGDDIVISNRLIDINENSFGLGYFRGKVLDFGTNLLKIMVTFIPQGSFVSGSLWYVISATNQINIPISDNYYYSLLDSSEILGYNIINGVSSARLQITKNPKFDKYVFRYKPSTSNTWRYSEVDDLNTIITNLLPNTVYWYQIMGFNTYTNDYCGFSSTKTFNTFF